MTMMTRNVAMTAYRARPPDALDDRGPRVNLPVEPRS